MWQHNYEPDRRESGHVGRRGGHSDLRAVPHARRAAEAGVDVGAGGAGVRAARRAGGLRHARATGGHLHRLRRGLRDLSRSRGSCSASIMLYRLAVDTGKFEIIKDSVGGLTDDRRLQAMFIAFSFGAFIEGAAGFGAPVAVSGAMLAGLGFNPFYAAGICLLANTAPGGVRLDRHSGDHARQRHRAAGPAAERDGRPALRDDLGHHPRLPDRGDGRMPKRAMEVLPAIVACGVSFAGVQFYVSNYIGPGADRHHELAHLHRRHGGGAEALEAEEHHAARGRQAGVADDGRSTPAATIFMAWLPYLMLVVFVLVWGEPRSSRRSISFADSLLPASLPTVPETARLATRLMVPGPAQRDHADAARGAEAGAVRGTLRAELAERVGHGVPAGHRRHRAGPARQAGKVVADLRGHLQAAQVRDADHRVRCSAWRT